MPSVLKVIAVNNEIVRSMKWVFKREFVYGCMCVCVGSDGKRSVSDDALHWARTLRGDRRAALLLDMAESEETFHRSLLLYLIQSD